MKGASESLCFVCTLLVLVIHEVNVMVQHAFFSERLKPLILVSHCIVCKRDVCVNKVSLYYNICIVKPLIVELVIDTQSIEVIDIVSYYIAHKINIV